MPYVLVYFCVIFVWGERWFFHLRGIVDHHCLNFLLTIHQLIITKLALYSKKPGPWCEPWFSSKGYRLLDGMPKINIIHIKYLVKTFNKQTICILHSVYRNEFHNLHVYFQTTETKFTLTNYMLSKQRTRTVNLNIGSVYLNTSLYF